MYISWNPLYYQSERKLYEWLQGTAGLETDGPGWMKKALC
jgi:hypothetical protein